MIIQLLLDTVKQQLVMPANFSFKDIYERL